MSHRALLGAMMAIAGLSCSPDGIEGVDPTDEALSERAYFETEVLPVFETQCGTSACHAAGGDSFDDLDPSYFVFPVDEEGAVSGDDRIDKAHARARDKISAEGPALGELIRKPLHESLGGLPHRGGVQYSTMGDEALERLLAWAEMARPEPAALEPLVEQFRDEIVPILRSETCMISSCHGPSSANGFRLDAGMIGELDHHALLHNYEQTVFFLNLETPDPMLSRLLRKTIPLDQGGIPHRGGNAFFDPAAGDPGVSTLTDFVEDLRAEVGDDDKGELTGLVFVATDPTPRNLFDITAWQPGGDVYRLSPPTPGGTLDNLTAALHDAPADIRDPAVDYDGERIAFAMRKSLEDCLNIYVMNLDGTGLVQLTHDSGTLPGGIRVANVEPLWGPDDRIYFVSTRVGTLAAHGGYPRSNLWRMDADGGHLVQMTFGAGYEIAPAWRFFEHPSEDQPELHTLDVVLTATRKVGAQMHGPIMRLPAEFRSDYHPHYGTQHPDYAIFTQLTQLPDQRETLILTDEANVWEGGALAIIDRNLGPVIKDGGESAVVNYIEGLQKLAAPGQDVPHTGFSSAGYFRDPHALPDGSIVVSRSHQPIDLTDPEAQPDTALWRLRIRDLAASERAVVTEEIELVDLPGKIETDPRPILRKRREVIGDPLDHVANGTDVASVLTFDQAVQHVLGREDSPSNEKPFDEVAEAMRYVRLVEEVPVESSVDPAAIGRGGHGMRRVLAEFPSLSDRSMYAELPAGVPYFVQTLDDTRAAVTTFNQWFYLLPGEKLTQVTRREVYDNRCGPCHGSTTGMPGETVATPDILTQASRVEANYDPETDSDVPPVPRGIEPSERIEVDFEQHVQPILSNRCATSGCHAPGAVPPDLSQRPGEEGYSGAYEALTDPGEDSGHGFGYVDAASSRSRTSYLAEVLLGRDLEAPRSYDSQGCPGGESLPLAELSTFMRWMDIGANFLGDAPPAPPSLPEY